MHKVVAIDDEENVLLMVTKMLESIGDYKVLCETSGKKGMALVKKELPSLVIVDVMMEDIIGTELLKGLKSDPATSFIPVIIMTGNKEDKEEIMSNAMGSYADAFLSKPFSRSDLETKVTSILKSRGAL